MNFMKKWKGKLILLIIVVLIGVKFVTIRKHEGFDRERLGNMPRTNACLALNYHRVREKSLWDSVLEATMQPDELIKYTVYTDEFEKQIDFLIEEGAYFATLEEVSEFKRTGNFPDKCVYISFDDADATTYEYAYPILKERNIPFTIFVIAGQVGKGDFNNIRMATWDQLREINESGLVTFGAHTYDMHYLGDNNKAVFLNPDKYDEFYEDAVKSKEKIKSELDVEVTSIAYPFGETSDGLTEETIKAGFETAYILAPDVIKENDDDYYMNRFLIERKNFYDIVVPWITGK